MTLNEEAIPFPSLESGKSSEPGKRPYVEPDLMEWGTLLDLTRGPVIFIPDDLEGGTSSPET